MGRIGQGGAKAGGMEKTSFADVEAALRGAGGEAWDAASSHRLRNMFEALDKTLGAILGKVSGAQAVAMFEAALGRALNNRDSVARLFNDKVPEYSRLEFIEICREAGMLDRLLWLERFSSGQEVGPAPHAIGAADDATAAVAAGAARAAAHELRSAERAAAQACAAAAAGLEPSAPRPCLGRGRERVRAVIENLRELKANRSEELRYRLAAIEAETARLLAERTEQREATEAERAAVEAHFGVFAAAKSAAQAIPMDTA